jgi:hypothetical protein
MLVLKRLIAFAITSVTLFHLNVARPAAERVAGDG